MDAVAGETPETWAADGPQQRNTGELALFFWRSSSSTDVTPRTAMLFEQATAQYPTPALRIPPETAKHGNINPIKIKQCRQKVKKNLERRVCSLLSCSGPPP